MMHINVTYVPDCPMCGTEAELRMRYLPGTATGCRPFGIKAHRWRCPACGWESEEVRTADLDKLTYRLTESLRREAVSDGMEGVPRVCT